MIDAEQLDDLVGDARVIAWSEGVHLREEFLLARNLAVDQLVARGVRLLCAETHFGLATAADEYLRGGVEEPTTAAVGSVWSWAREPLAANAELLRLLAAHNRAVPSDDRVRFCGLDVYGAGADGPVARLRSAIDAASEPEDRRRLLDIQGRLTRHVEAGGDHRAIAVRDDLQYRNLIRVARSCRPTDRIMIFEQVEHLDPSRSGSLGNRIAAGELGPVVTIGALWGPEDSTVRYPLGPYRPLAEWLDRRVGSDAADFTLVDLRPWRHSTEDSDRPAASSPFDAVLYVPRTTPATR